MNQHSSESAHPAYRPDIDGLRAVAVLAVIIFHAFPSSLHGGFVGVDVFFVISGFLISSILFKNLRRGSFSYADFYKRRVKRIFPVLSIVLFATALGGFFFLLPKDLITLGKHIAGGAGFASNLVLWKELGYFDQSSEVKPLLHLWSLGIEEQYYLIWPIFLTVLWKLKGNFPRWIAGVLLLSLVWCIYLTAQDASAAFYLPFSRLWELCLGSYLAWWTLEKPNFLKDISILTSMNEERLKKIFSWSGLLFVLLGIFMYHEKIQFPGWWAILPTLGSALLIAAGPTAPVNRGFLARSWMVNIGLISYPLYLWHWPLLVYMKMALPFAPATVLDRWRFILIALSFLFSWLCYKFVEKPIRASSHEKAKVAALCMAVFGIGAAGYGIFRSDGFVGRFPQTIRKYIEPVDFNFNQEARFGICHFDSRVPGHAVVGQDPCVENKRPLVFIWGDSFASALYPGLKELQKHREFGIAQATECGTPPVLDIKWSNGCADANKMNEWNQQTLKEIGKDKPDILLMHAYWTAYGDNAWLKNHLTDILPKIREQSPKTKIIVIGSVPEWGTWTDGLPILIYRHWRGGNPSEEPPIYMKDGLTSEVHPESSEFLASMKELGVTYISPYEIFCKPEGCLTRVGPQATDLTAIDLGHLSKAGSIYFFQHAENQIFQ